MPVFEVEANGKTYEVEAPDVASATKALGSMGAPKPDVSASTALGRGAASGATLGWYDEINGAMRAGGLKPDQPWDAKAAIKGLFGLVTGDQAAKSAYQEGRGQARGEMDAAQQAHPNYYLGGQLAGGLVTSAPLAPFSTGATAAGTVARGIGMGAGLGAVQGAGDAAEMADIPKDAAVGGAVGGVVGGAVPTVLQGLRRVVSPATEANPTRRALVDALRNEGVDLTAGQQTGNKFVRYLESTANDMPVVGGGIDDVMTRQKEQFTRAALQRAGTAADRATPDVMDATRTALGQQFQDLSARNTLRFDQGFAQDIQRVLNDYANVLPTHQRQVIINTLGDLAQQGGQIPGTMYQSTRSRLSRMAQNNRANDPDYAEALRGLRNALDANMARSIAPDDAAAWNEARRMYGNYRTIGKAMEGAGADTAEGLLSPQQLRTSVKMRNGDAYVRGQGDLAELARAGAGVMAPLPQSGTAPRLMAQHMITGLLPSALGAAAGGASSGDTEGALAGAASGALVARSLLSRPGQAYLANQLLAGSGGANRRVIEALLSAPARTYAVDQTGGR